MNGPSGGQSQFYDQGDPPSEAAARPASLGQGRRYVADFSLALINRTGAYHVARDLLAMLPDRFAATRYWRVVSKRQPEGLARWLLGKSMLIELTRASIGSGSRRGIARHGDLPTLFLDPLYVIAADIRRDDIVLCHDLGPISHPDLFDGAVSDMYRRAYHRIAEALPMVVFVSEASRREFVAHFGDRFCSLVVIPLYVRRGVEDADEGVAVPGVRRPFLLTIGASELRKNHARAIEAFGKAGLADRGYTYVCCGPRGNAAAEVETLIKATPAVRNLGFRSDAELRWLYRNAHGFVLPSLLEGFGLPGLEAAQHRLPSLVSAGGAQEEAVGGAAVLVDPYSVASIADGMIRLVDMPDAEREAILAKALHCARELTLDRYIQRWSHLLR